MPSNIVRGALMTIADNSIDDDFEPIDIKGGDKIPTGTQ